MKYAVFTVSLPEWTPEQAAAILPTLGYHGVEWRVIDQPPSPDGAPSFWAGNRCTWPLASFERDAPRIRALTETHGLAMPNVGTYCTCAEPSDVERAMRAAAALGAPSIRVRAPNYDGRSSYFHLWETATAQFRDVEALARANGVRALIEVHMGTLLPSASASARFVQRFDPAHIGVIYDAGNLVYEGFETYRMGLEVLGPHLGMVHLKSAAWRMRGRRADGGADWAATFAPLRDGIVDVPALIEALAAVGYDGWISFEDFSTERPLEQRLRDNLKYVRGIVGQSAT